MELISFDYEGGPPTLMGFSINPITVVILGFCLGISFAFGWYIVSLFYLRFREFIHLHEMTNSTAQNRK